MKTTEIRQFIFNNIESFVGHNAMLWKEDNYGIYGMLSSTYRRVIPVTDLHKWGYISIDFKDIKEINQLHQNNWKFNEDIEVSKHTSNDRLVFEIQLKNKKGTVLLLINPSK